MSNRPGKNNHCKVLPEIIEKLHKWENIENSLAPLSADQRNTCLDLGEAVSGRPHSSLILESCESAGRKTDNNSQLMKTPTEFSEWYSKFDLTWSELENDNYKNYENSLHVTYEKVSNLLSQTECVLNKLNELKTYCEDITDKTDAVHNFGKRLAAEQKTLEVVCDEIDARLLPFKKLQIINKNLDSSHTSIKTDSFGTLLDDINYCMESFKKHNSYLESNSYLIQTRHVLSNALSHIKSYICHVLDSCKVVQSSSEILEPIADNSMRSTRYMVQYGRFQANAHRLKPILTEIENRIDSSPEYELMLSECQRHYVTLRQSLIQPSVNEDVTKLVAARTTDYCSLLRSLSNLLLYMSQDEDKLYYQFFTKSSNIFTEYMESICSIMYDTMRPLIIHIKHLESLAEICSVLRVEILQDRVKMNSVGLQAFGNVAEQLLQDVQERLVFRANIYFKTDIADFRPSSGDLAYPEMLEMMKNIAEEIRMQEISSSSASCLSRCESRFSINSIGSTGDSIRTSASRYSRHTINSSTADLQGMWYPAVKRTLVCLSRLYRCVEKPIFQSLAQEAISCCTSNITEASRLISSKKTATDGYLFLIRHLLILREQIAPFQVDLTVKETTLDFSNLKNAAYDLIQKHNNIFSLSSNNAILEFILHGSPTVRENCLDSRKIVDKQLKNVCESFIDHVTKFAVSPIQIYLDKVQNYTAAIKTVRGESNDNSVMPSITEYEFGKPENVRSMVQDCLRKLKIFVLNLHNMMSLYLANPDTQSTLFKPIKNNIVGIFLKLQSSIHQNYAKDDQLIIASPTPEQISITLSSISLSSSSRKSSVVEKQQKTSTSDQLIQS